MIVNPIFFALWLISPALAIKLIAAGFIPLLLPLL